MLQIVKIPKLYIEMMNTEKRESTITEAINYKKAGLEILNFLKRGKF